MEDYNIISKLKKPLFKRGSAKVDSLNDGNIYIPSDEYIPDPPAMTDEEIEEQYQDYIKQELIKPYMDKESWNQCIGTESSAQNPPRKYYASTVNIQPTKLMNKRPWKKYNHDDQRKILMRVEASFRRKYPTVELIELQYEVCPKLKNIHYHALYLMTDDEEHELYNYFKKICCSEDAKTLIPWRFMYNKIIPKNIMDIQGWLDYMRKELNKEKLYVSNALP